MRKKINQKFYSNYLSTAKNLLTVVIVILLKISCKKEVKDSITITILSPSIGYSASFGDTIHVRAFINATSVLQSVSVEITDVAANSLSDPQIVVPGVNEFLFETDYVPFNTNATSGNFILSVSAKTQHGFNHQGVSIFLESMPILTKAIYVATASDTLSFSIWEIDSSGPVFRKTVPGDFNNLAVSSHYNSLSTSGKISGGIHYYALPDFIETFTLPPANPPPLPTFMTHYFDSERNYLGFYNGAIRSYDQNGFQQFDSGDDVFFRPTLLLRNSDYVIAEMTNTASHQNNIAAYFYPSGARRQIIGISFDIVAMFPKSNDEIFLFGMQNDHLRIYTYSIAGNNVNLVKDAGVLQLNAAVQVAGNDFLLGCDEGLFHYTYANGSNVNVASFACNFLEINSIDNVVYCASGNRLHTLAIASFASAGTIAMNDSILNVRVLYTK